MERIVVLGGTGFVGRNVCEVLKENGYEFIVLSRSTGVDFRDPVQCSKVFAELQPDLAINCAAHVGSLNYVTVQAADVMLDNSRMILGMYEASAKKSPKTLFINPIANCAYPGKAETYFEDQWQDGPLHRSVLAYGATRRLLWSVAESFAMQYGIRSINLLVPNMYGPFDSTDPNKAHALNALISKFVKAEKTGQKVLDIWGTGVAIREWLYARDFGRIVAEIIKRPKMVGLAEPLNIAQNFGLSVRELVELIATYFVYSGEIRYDASKPDGAPKKVMDDRRFRKVFEDFAFTPFDEGIKATIGYYESMYPY